MKTRFFLLLLITFALFSCQKEKTDPATEQDVTFTATQIDPGAGLKGTTDWDWKCDPTLQPVYAEIDIYQGTTFIGTFRPAVFYLDGKLYTQAIKLPVGPNNAPLTYTVDKFLVMDDMGTPADLTDDEIYMATPATGALYSQYTNPDVRFDFVVEAFKKAEIPVQVLCFIPAEYDGFGFDWFVITEIIIREQCFFGDLCVKHTDDYLGSHYALQPGGLKIDMPAIFRVDVYKGGVFVESFTNDVAPNYGVGSPVCVKYADILGVTDVFTFELWIMVKQGPNFPFVLFKTLTFNDIWNIADGDDDVYDFVLGNCNLTDPDLQLAPWQNLPTTCDLVVGNSAPGTKGTYFDVTLSNIPSGYDIYNGIWGVYCADQETNITGGSSHPGIGVYSSLYPALLPAYVEAQAKANLDQANWLMNHLGNYSGYNWVDVQNALWVILDYNAAFPSSIGALSTVATQMAADAANNDGYVPLPGGWAAVVFCESSTVQIIFTLVDP